MTQADDDEIDRIYKIYFMYDLKKIWTAKSISGYIIRFSGNQDVKDGHWGQVRKWW